MCWIAIVNNKKLSDTRWVYHYRCAHVLKEWFGSVVHTVNMIIKYTKSTPLQNTASRGTSLQLESWSFAFWITALMEILTGIHTLNELLHKKAHSLGRFKRGRNLQKDY